MSLADGELTGLKDKVSQYRDRRAARIAARYDEEPDSWITVRGNHIPIDKEKNPIGGQQKALGASSEKGVKDFYPKNSYQETDEFKEMIRIRKNAFKKKGDSFNEIKRFEEEIKGESRPKPKSEWTEEDEFLSLIGDRPTEYTEKGKKIKEEYDQKRDELWSNIREAEKDIAKSNEIEDRLTRKERRKQLKEYHQNDLKKSESDDYEGFKSNTTGTSFGDEYIRNGEGFIAEMSPKEYLERCAYEVFQRGTMETTLRAIDNNLCREYAQKMKDGEKFDMPYLDYQSNGQEGRHRAIAAYMNGIEKIPVLVIGNPPKKEDLIRKRKQDSSDDISRFRNRRQDRIDARMDAEEPDSWITVNGNHIPLNEEGKAIGGQPKALGEKISIEEADKIIKDSGNISALESDISWAEERVRDAEIDLEYAETDDEKREATEKLKGRQKELDSLNSSLKRYNEAVLTKFPTYKDCAFKQDVEMRLKASGNLRRGAKVDFSGCYVENEKRICEGIDRFISEVPEMKGVIAKIIPNKMDDWVYAGSNGFREIEFNPLLFDGNLHDKYMGDVGCGFHPKGTDEGSIILHELTHVLEDIANDGGRKGSKFSTSIFKNVSKKLGLSEDECFDGVSAYSRKENSIGKYSEWLAEAYSEYLGSKDPRPIAKEVGKLVAEELKKRGIRK